MDKKEKLKIDDQAQTIQGMKISDPDLYKKIRFIVQNNHLEGWQPTEQEINDLVHDETDLSEDYYPIFGEKRCVTGFKRLCMLMVR